MNKISLYSNLLFCTLISVLSSCGEINKNSYKPILNDDARFHYLFSNSVKDIITCEYSFGNNNEKLFAYAYKKDSRIIIYELGGLKNIPLDSVFIKNNLPDFIDYSKPYAGAEFGNPFISIRQSIDTIIGTGVSLYGDNLEISHLDSNTVILLGETSRLVFANIEGTRWIDFIFKDKKVLTEILIQNQGDKLILMIINPMQDKTDINDSFFNKEYLLKDGMAKGANKS
ncbi:hypothetical protein [Ancylomarina sp.]|uniref:hypothetical protein n=1 Tax=Ancylomarina sp. TaxID=1970196 RepID=UPI00356707DD